VADQPELRASDADRERVAEVLRESFAQGRLSAEEFHERTDAAYAAKTFAELAPLTADLPIASPAAVDPSWRPVVSPHDRLPQDARGQLQRIWGGWVTMTVVLTTIWLLSGANGGYWPAWPVGIFGAVCLARTINGSWGRR
jgi:hypothetical protein